MTNGYQLRDVAANTITIRVALAGDGPPLLLLHGWPHTWALWHSVMPALARSHRVIAPDLRGIGATTRPDDGYDLHTLADDAAALLHALGAGPAGVVGIDLGASVAWMLAVRHPERVGRLAIMEGLLGRLPGAERFLAAGPPWWFGFHAAPGGLAETVLEGHEAEYLDWFLRAGTAGGRGVDRATRDAFVDAYRGRDALRGGFAHYRALAANAELVAAAAALPRPAIPTLAIAGGVVGDALARQLRPITADLTTATIQDCGHLIPLEQPDALVAALTRHLAG